MHWPHNESERHMAQYMMGHSSLRQVPSFTKYPMGQLRQMFPAGTVQVTQGDEQLLLAVLGTEAL